MAGNTPGVDEVAGNARFCVGGGGLAVRPVMVRSFRSGELGGARLCCGPGPVRLAPDPALDGPCVGSWGEVAA